MQVPIAALAFMLASAVAADPDAVVTAITAPARLASSSPEVSAAYGIGTTTCNLGNSALPYVPFNEPVHPVFVQNLYRVRNGRIEQIGLSWAFHTFCPLQNSACVPCTPDPETCMLGPGCSDTDTAQIAGSWASLGPRSQVNAATALYIYPNARPTSAFPAGRLHVQNTDLNPALNSGAAYFSEILMVAPADAAAGNSDNNVSHRPVSVGSFVSGAWNVLNTGTDQFDQQPAIAALQRVSPLGSVITATEDIAGDGRVIVASAAWYQGPRSWRYEYAVYNQSSDQSVGRFSVPIIPNFYIDVTGTEFRGVTHHSGEVWSSDPWTVTHHIGDVTDVWDWATQTFDENPNANAIRWGTLYNFTLYSDSPPAEGGVRLGLFKPGAVQELHVPALVPSQACAADFDHDSIHTVGDIFSFLTAWFAGDDAADVDGAPGLGVADIFSFLGDWFTGCP